MKIPKIVPIAVLRDSKKTLEMCSKEKEPIIITRNGYAELVIMKVDKYFEMAEELNLLREKVAQMKK